GHCATGGAACGTDADCGTSGPCTAGDCQTPMPKGLTIFKWVAQLNAAKFAGHSDWRVPNVKELQDLVDYTAANPAIAPAFHGANWGWCGRSAEAACACTQSSHYWSSTTSPASGAPGGAWAVYFANGAVFSNTQDATYYVRAVRSGR